MLLSSFSLSHRFFTFSSPVIAMLFFWVNQFPIISSSISLIPATIRLSQIAMPKQQGSLTLSMCFLPWLTSIILFVFVLLPEADAIQTSRLCLLLLNSGLTICYEVFAFLPKHLVSY
jgi:hypothetical protein